jgi:hypothetical protein
MAFGLPSAEQMRDYLISIGVDAEEATKRANVAARSNAAQAARTSALSLVAGAAPARATGAAAVEAAPAIARSVMGVGERIAAAPRQIMEYLTVPAGVVRNPTTGARIPTRNVTSGRMERTPDYFLPGQRVAQGTAGATALGAGTAGVGALTDRPVEAPKPIDPEIKTRDGQPVYFTGPQFDINDKRQSDYMYSTPAEVLGSRRATASAIDSAYAPVVSSPAPATASQQAVQQARTQTAPMPPTRPAELAREQPSILSRIFSGEDYQSKGGKLRQDGRINWGDPESAADFFRADKARMETPEATGMKRGGAAGKPDSVHKALEIIHHLLTRSH